MQTQYLSPFLESASMVIQQMCNVAPAPGQMSVKEIACSDDHLWIMIGMTGELRGDVLYGLKKQVALRIASAMMGGYPVQELDELGKSAISELGNMISGNASTLLASRGVSVDITPPRLVEGGDTSRFPGKAWAVPLHLGELGEIEIHVVVFN